MRFPLNIQVLGGYDYGQKTTYNDHHLGVDWKAKFEPLYAPCDGIIFNISEGPEAGKAIQFRPQGEKRIIRWVHLSKILVINTQMVKEGQQLAVTGNSGATTTGPHLHEDMWPKGRVTLKFEDTANPHDYYKKRDMPIFKIKNDGTLYALIGGVLVPFMTDYPTYLKDFPNVPLVELDSLEASQFSKAQAVVIASK